jgi:hypothetical protein
MVDGWQEPGVDRHETQDMQRENGFHGGARHRNIYTLSLIGSPD